MDNRLSRYLAVAAGGTAASLQGQVLYTDFSPDLVLEGNLQSVLIDVNQDSIEDFVLIAEDTLVPAINGSYSIGRIRAGGYANLFNLVLGTQPSQYGYVNQLDHGDDIGPDQPFLFAGTMAFQVDSAFPFNEPWNGGAFDKYIGFQIRYTNDSSHYGWIRLDVSDDARRAVIKDAAFSLIPDTVIAAGYEQLSTEEVNLDEYVFAHGDQIHFRLSRNWLGTEFSIYDALGRIVWQWTADVEQMRVRPELVNGTYIIVARQANGILSRKKLVFSGE